MPYFIALWETLIWSCTCSSLLHSCIQKQTFWLLVSTAFCNHSSIDIVMRLIACYLSHIIKISLQNSRIWKMRTAFLSCFHLIEGLTLVHSWTILCKTLALMVASIAYIPAGYEEIYKDHEGIFHPPPQAHPGTKGKPKIPAKPKVISTNRATEFTLSWFLCCTLWISTPCFFSP